MTPGNANFPMGAMQWRSVVGSHAAFTSDRQDAAKVQVEGKPRY